MYTKGGDSMSLTVPQILQLVICLLTAIWLLYITIKILILIDRATVLIDLHIDKETEEKEKRSLD